MRRLAVLAFAHAIGLAACVHGPARPGDPAPAGAAATSSRSTTRSRRAYRRAEPIHVAIAPRIREVSVVHGEIIRVVSAANLPPPGKRPLAVPPANRTRTAAPARPPRTPADLRARVGLRDNRDPSAIALAWAVDLGMRIDATSSELVAWAERHGRLLDPDVATEPGDLLVFDKVVSGAEADLVAIAIGRDARGVTEFIYVGNGVVRRGFVDAARPARRRDAAGAVVNTFLRHGRRWPLKGSHYLAGEHLAHVVR